MTPDRSNIFVLIYAWLYLDYYFLFEANSCNNIHGERFEMGFKQTPLGKSLWVLILKEFQPDREIAELLVKFDCLYSEISSGSDIWDLG